MLKNYKTAPTTKQHKYKTKLQNNKIQNCELIFFTAKVKRDREREKRREEIE